MSTNDTTITANVYKIRDELTSSEIVHYLTASSKKEKMELVKEIKHDGSTFKLLKRSEDRGNSGWLSSINKLFSTDIEQQSGQLLKVLILVTTIKKNNYVAIYGYSKSYVEDLIDGNFGLDFAAKAIKDYQIDAKNVDYLQKNTLRSSINYKRDRFELPQANEAFFGIVGTPTHFFYGNKINCKEGVAFSKKFSIDNEDFFKLFTEIDNTLELPNEIPIPRLKKISTKRDLSNYLSKKLLNHIQNKNHSNIDVSFNVPYLHNLDEKITDLDSNFVYRISCRVESTGKYIKKDVDVLETSVIENFLKVNKKIYCLEDVNIIMYDGIHDSSHEVRRSKLIKLILCELEICNKLYLLQNGFWGTLNSSFLDVMTSQLSIIENHSASHGTDLIEFANKNNSIYSLYNSNFFSDKNRKNYAGENGYIETVVRTNTPRVVKLHKRLITGNGVKNEIADFYDSNLKEIFAVKMGTLAGDCVYSFEQSIVSIYLLKNKKLFDLTSKLIQYNDPTNYNQHQILPTSIINDIQNVNNINVLWVIPKSKNAKVNKKIANNCFTINDIGSFMVKIKLIEWYNTCLQYGLSPKIIMVDADGVLNSLPPVPNHSYFKSSQHGQLYYS
ncbi:DUF6119 family protein [Enterococcus gilvus]|uniref:DUF6119 family protein n=1 Tax=Enterococcus gilvus TaxID=160453 RepID=UPI003D6A7BAF